MAEGAQNHYQVLRIERTADERAIKKAYFTLIREFPPDKHPEEFKRIREAYEVLSDPVARQRFDAADKGFEEYGPDVAAALKDIEETIKSGDEPAVQRKARALLEEHPDLAIARENLAFSYLRAGSFQEALDAFKELSKASPDEARYHLYKGIAYNRLEKPEKALVSVKKAHDLKPDDTRIHVALIDLLMGLRRLKDTLAEIDDALERHGPKSEPAIALGIRRLDALFSLGDVDDADTAATAFFDHVREMGDPELRKYVSSQLAAVGARLFARDEPDRANAVLRRCEDIHPESAVDHPYPQQAEILVDDLPQVGRDWLARQKPGPNSATIAESIWAGPFFAFIGAALTGAVVLFSLFDRPSAWEAPSLVFITLAFGGVAAGLAWAARAAVRIVTSPLRAFTTVHPLYLVKARGDRIQVYPLFRISQVHGVHHHTNGGYTHTAITINFGGPAIALTIRGKDLAQGWLDYVSSCRRRSLELMMEGYLEAEHGVELIPPALLTQAPRSKQNARSSLVRWYGGAAAAAAVVLALVIPIRARAADEYAFRVAVRIGTPASYQGYLDARPDGRHAEAAKRLAQAQAERAESQHADADARSPGSKALGAAIDALGAASAVTIPVTVTSRFDLPEIKGDDIGDPRDAYHKDVTAQRDAALVARLGRAIEGIRPGKKITLKLVASEAERTGPAWISIIHETHADGASLRGNGMPPVPSVKVDWQIAIASTGTPVWRWSTTTEAPTELRLPRPADLKKPRFAALAFAQLEDLAFDAFAQRVVLALGLREPTPPATQAKSRSPYGR